MSSPLLSQTQLDTLVEAASAGPRRRQHANIHQSFDDPCQRFFNAICRDSYIPPHRHSGATDEETIIALRGAFAAVLFDESGGIETVARCGDDYEGVGMVIPVGQWHSVVALTETAVVIEIKAGPFDPQRAKEFASWAPAESDASAGPYQARLLAECRRVGSNHSTACRERNS